MASSTTCAAKAKHRPTHATPNCLAGPLPIGLHLSASQVPAASNAPVQARWANAQRAGPAPPSPSTVAYNRLLAGSPLLEMPALNDLWIIITLEGTLYLLVFQQDNELVLRHVSVLRYGANMTVGPGGHAICE